MLCLDEKVEEFLRGTHFGKLGKVGRDDRVCLLVDNGYSYVAVFGRARVAKERDPLKGVETLATRHHGQEKGSKMARDRLRTADRVSFEEMPEMVASGPQVLLHCAEEETCDKPPVGLPV